MFCRTVVSACLCKTNFFLWSQSKGLKSHCLSVVRLFPSPGGWLLLMRWEGRCGGTEGMVTLCAPHQHPCQGRQSQNQMQMTETRRRPQATNWLFFSATGGGECSPNRLTRTHPAPSSPTALFLGPPLPLRLSPEQAGPSSSLC